MILVFDVLYWIVATFSFLQKINVLSLEKAGIEFIKHI